MGSRDVKPHLHKVAKGPEDTADAAGELLRARGPFESAEASAAAARGGEAARKSLARQMPGVAPAPPPQ